MKRLFFAIMFAACFAIAAAAQQSAGSPPPSQQSGQQSPTQPSLQQPAPPGSQPAAAPAGPHPPTAKTDNEFAAYNAAVHAATPDDMEKGADEFAVKYPDSELRQVVFQQVMQSFWRQNNAAKVLLWGKKTLEAAPDNPLALAMTAFVLAERTQETDVDHNERLNEAVGNVDKLTSTIDQSLPLLMPKGATPEQLQGARSQLLAMGYGAKGRAQLELKQDDAARESLEKALQIDPSDARNRFRLALALDHQGHYPEALAAVNQALQNGQDDPVVKQQGEQEKTRLQQLATPSTPAAAPKPPSQ